ncbi:hypothetical protein [Dictyobacter formicarum]|uniref:ABC transmembrane type-1 domain-containing protein n=1 Tax=Dictyobacter formicarum TaxID=2778368 RepID=A0ABQ3V882_9CHLR|nr:hypothetical protein [Dictyobacter formicarum]GHO82018.1 hypothetical protein KSZ_00240 [Dictyobacter formicarum]
MSWRALCRNRPRKRHTSISWNLLMAAATLAIVPIVALYIFAQRWFVRGIVISGFGGR